jgi:hypothetical protein
LNPFDEDSTEWTTTDATDELLDAAAADVDRG